MRWVLSHLFIISLWISSSQCVLSSCVAASSCLPLQMLSFMRAQYTLFQQGYNILDEIDPYMKKLAAQVRANPCGWMLLEVSFESAWFYLPWSQRAPPAVCCVQLDQLVIDSAMEKREMEHKHALIQQRVREMLSAYTLSFFSSFTYIRCFLKSAWTFVKDKRKNRQDKQKTRSRDSFVWDVKNPPRNTDVFSFRAACAAKEPLLQYFCKITPNPQRVLQQHGHIFKESRSSMVLPVALTVIQNTVASCQCFF